MSGLLLPPSPQPPEGGGVTTSLDLYDTEIIAIERVLEKLTYDHVGQSRDIEGFVQRATSAFNDIGLVVDVSMWTAQDRRGQEVAGTFVPQITVTGRVDRNHEFDYDRQVHEVTADVLDLGEKGVISTKHMKPS